MNINARRQRGQDGGRVRVDGPDPRSHEVAQHAACADSGIVAPVAVYHFLDKPGFTTPRASVVREDETLGGRQETGASLVAALEKAGIEFIQENGGGAGVRLAKRGKRSK